MIAHLFLRIKKIFPLLAVLAATGMLAWLAYGFRHAPVLYSDDWTYIIGEYTRGDLQWFDWAGSRPLLDMPFSVLTSLFGLNIRAFYVVLMALHALAALQFYWLLRRIGLRERGIALGIALLFMVYPADYTHMWLTMINVWVCMNLLLGYAHLLLTFTRTGSAWAILAALAALLVSLGIYEAQLGLALLWPLLLLVLNRDIPRVRKALLLTPMLIGPVFAAWRMLGAPAIGITDPYVQRVELSPFVLLSRLWASSKLLLLWDWAIPVLRALDTQNNWLAWAIIGALVGLCWLIAAMLLRRRESWQGQEVAGSLQDVHRSLALAAAGLTLILAGYVPAIILSGATLYSIASRVHLFASIGASVFIAAILFGISSLVCHLRALCGLANSGRTCTADYSGDNDAGMGAE
jgi:hypothetical protein